MLEVIEITVLIFVVIQKYNEAFWGVYFLKIGEKIDSQISSRTVV